MATRKRGRLSPDSPRKRTKVTRAADDSDNEDSLESILAQIQAQEESEQLAKRLQAEWNASGSGPSASRAPRGAAAPANPPQSAFVDVSVIELSDGEDVPEDDEAMARRLAKQWADEDAVEIVPFPAPPRTATGKSKADYDGEVASVTKLEQYRNIFVGEKTCTCGAKLASPRGHVAFTEQVPPPSLVRLLHVACKKCKTNYCRGCMSPVSCSMLCKGNDGPCAAETCCANVRIIALYEALGALDRQYLSERETSDQRARAVAAKMRKSPSSSVGPGGTGYGTGGRTGYPSDHAFGNGRGRRNRGKAIESATISNRDALASHFDQILIRALKSVAGYLPAPYSDDPQIYDMIPHESIDALISLSQLPDLLGNLLRNDSVTDWIARIEVYHAMLALLKRMADCELTLQVLVGRRWDVSKSCGLEDWMWQEGEIVWERDRTTGTPLKTPPLYMHFKKLTKQCEAFLAGASGMLESGAAGDDESDVAEMTVKATSLCGDIIATRDDIERAMTVMGKDPATILQSLEDDESASSPSGPSSAGKGGADKGKHRDPAVDLERKYARECERLAFQYVSLSQPSPHGAGLEYTGYKYAPELKASANATRNPKDRLHLIKELAVMATSLPPGVWVRVDDVRNDAIKIMIAGPEGTPYAGGLFEFDCFIPLEYPNKPPLMHLRTTGGGTVRFNPNLYNCGKVCLSLLGTWPGRPEEQWSPKSTLLQVLVSIQSMILIELPYFNEPGYGKASPNNFGSIAYNKNICLQTTRWAIVDWLRDENRQDIWGEVIASHFLTRHALIRKCIEQWATIQPNIRDYTPSASAMLAKLAVGPSFNGPPPGMNFGFGLGSDMLPMGMGGPLLLPQNTHAQPSMGSLPLPTAGMGGFPLHMMGMGGQPTMGMGLPLGFGMGTGGLAPPPQDTHAHSTHTMNDFDDWNMDEELNHLNAMMQPPVAGPATTPFAPTSVAIHAPCHLGHVSRGGKKAATQKAPASLKPQGMNLIEEYDRGISRLRAWTFAEGEQQA